METWSTTPLKQHSPWIRIVRLKWTKWFESKWLITCSNISPSSQCTAVMYGGTTGTCYILKASAASSRYHGCNHWAISNGVITITNINSLWNSCPLFVQYKPTQLLQQYTALFPFHCYCSWFVFHTAPPATPLIQKVSSLCLIVISNWAWVWMEEKQEMRLKDSSQASAWQNYLMCQSNLSLRDKVTPKNPQIAQYIYL